MLSAATLPTWLGDYYDEALKCKFEGIDATVLDHMLELLDQVCLLTSRTQPNLIIDAVQSCLYNTKKCVWVAIKVRREPAGLPAVSYGNHPTKGDKKSVLFDTSRLEEKLRTHESFAGVHIDDFDGWRSLPDEPSETSSWRSWQSCSSHSISREDQESMTAWVHD